jgi:hypothetical protein
LFSGENYDSISPYKLRKRMRMGYVRKEELLRRGVNGGDVFGKVRKELRTRFRGTNFQVSGKGRWRGEHPDRYTRGVFTSLLVSYDPEDARIAGFRPELLRAVLRQILETVELDHSIQRVFLDEVERKRTPQEIGQMKAGAAVERIDAVLTSDEHSPEMKLSIVMRILSSEFTGEMERALVSTLAEEFKSRIIERVV